MKMLIKAQRHIDTAKKNGKSEIAQFLTLFNRPEMAKMQDYIKKQLEKENDLNIYCGLEPEGIPPILDLTAAEVWLFDHHSDEALAIHTAEELVEKVNFENLLFSNANTFEEAEEYLCAAEKKGLVGITQGHGGILQTSKFLIDHQEDNRPELYEAVNFSDAKYWLFLQKNAERNRKNSLLDEYKIIPINSIEELAGELSNLS